MRSTVSTRARWMRRALLLVLSALAPNYTGYLMTRRHAALSTDEKDDIDALRAQFPGTAP